MVKKIESIKNFEVDVRVLKSVGSDDVISLLLQSNKETALSVNQLLEIINTGRRKKLNRTNIDRTIQNLKKFEPAMLKSKSSLRSAYYWMVIPNVNKPQVAKKVNSNLTNLKEKSKNQKNETTQNNTQEKDLYPKVKAWLSNLEIEGERFEYQILGGGFLDNKSKFSNPDLIGRNSSRNPGIFKTVSVEVKSDLVNNAELIGFAQCCSYLLFSNYVFFVCVKPKLPEQEDKIVRITKLCEHFGIGLLFIGDTKLTVGPRLNHPNDFILKTRILSLFAN
jgi:hypothetical protein